MLELLYLFFLNLLFQRLGDMQKAHFCGGAFLLFCLLCVNHVLYAYLIFLYYMLTL